MAAHHHLPPLFHLPLLLAWLVSVGQPDSTERNKTSSKTERYPDFALENMSKSCWRPSRFHMTVFPARAVRLRRMVTHAWAVIISHAAVSRGVSGPSMLLCGSPGWVLVGFTAAGAPGEATSLPPLHHLWKLCLTGARRNRAAAHELATRRHSSATLSAVHRNSLTLIHTLTHADNSPPSVVSPSLPLTLAAATPVDVDAAVEPLLNYFHPHFGFQREVIPLHSASCSRSSILQRRQEV